ncbi:glycosyltransferase family 4 protein [Almyronema epifaneia]|uniref:Glycosyltransferase family 4 protein n=1 Tax=Almyronema epifaneia S1 TaxID=2991925 RepID=A0ABW6ICU1_9CYAN
MILVNLAYLLSKPTGTTTYALNLLPHLEPLHPCCLATPSSQLMQYHSVPSNMTAEFGMAGHLRRLLWTQFRLPQIYQQQAAQLLFSPITEAPLRSRCRFVVTVHDLTPLRFPALFSSLKWLYRYYVPQVLQAAEHIICDSEATASDIVTFYGIKANKITPILLAHDANQFRPLELATKNYFLILGRHAPYKNISGAIAAFAQLPERDRYELWIAGPYDSRYTPVLESQAATLGLASHIKFLQYVPYAQLPQLLSQAIALVFPSFWEGFGLPALEAMACGTPVIASNLSSLPEVTGSAAWLIDPHNTDEMATAMHAIATCPPLRQQLSEAGLKRASQFSWEKTGKATVAVLQSCL